MVTPINEMKRAERGKLVEGIAFILASPVYRQVD